MTTKVEQDNKYVRSLVENAQRGKIGSLEELFEMSVTDIYTLIVRITGDKKSAERFTIDTLVIAWKEIKKQAPEHISFENWLRNIAIKITICGLIGSKECEKKLKNKSSATTNEKEPYSTDPLENAIAGLDNESRTIFVLNKISGKPLTTFLGFLGVTKTDAETKLADSIQSITNSISDVESEVGLDTLIESLPTKIQPDKDLLEIALSNINEIRIKELKEIDANSEELKELIKIEKKRKAVLKKKYKDKKVVYKEGKELKYSDKLIISALLIVSLVSFFLYLITAPNEWIFSSISGKPVRNNAPIVKQEEVLSGDLISTNDVSTASIDISKIGRINIFSNTSFKRLEEDNRAELHHGKLIINTLGSNDYLHIFIPEATIEDIELGSRYSVDVDSDGNSQIVLEKGWLRVKSDSDAIIFPQKYSLRIVKSKGVSLPYHSKSNLFLVSLIEEYLFNGKQSTALNSILLSSTEKEAIMLWNLLPRVNEAQRSAVYDKLYELVPHTNEITKSDMLSLDKRLLLTWLEEIKWYL